MDIKNQIDKVLSIFPDFEYNENEKTITGRLFVSKQDSYLIEIHIGNFPLEFPEVYEIGGRIPRRVERHIYSNTGSCCFTTSAKAQIFLKTKIKSLKLFVEDIVVPWFQNNSYYEIHREYYTEEYSHDGSGVIEGYKDILQINNPVLIAKILIKYCYKQKLRVRDDCYCGSGIKLKKCSRGLHDKCYRKLRMVSKEIVLHDLNNIFHPYLNKMGMLRK